MDLVQDYEHWEQHPEISWQLHPTHLESLPVQEKTAELGVQGVAQWCTEDEARLVPPENTILIFIFFKLDPAVSWHPKLFNLAYKVAQNFEEEEEQKYQGMYKLRPINFHEF